MGIKALHVGPNGSILGSQKPGPNICVSPSKDPFKGNPGFLSGPNLGVCQPHPLPEDDWSVLLVDRLESEPGNEVGQVEGQPLDVA